MRWTVVAALAVCSWSTTSAQVPDDLRIEGMVETYAGLRMAEPVAFLAARSRAEVGLTYDADRGRLVVRPRATHDALTEELRLDLREAYVDVYGSGVDVRLGHQLIAWGRSDGVFVTDLLAPLDLSEFVAQPPEDIRSPLTAALGTFFLGDWEASLVLVPQHPRSRLPDSHSPWFPGPESVLGVPVEVVEPPDERRGSLDLAETAIRVTWRGLPLSDLSILWINGFNRVPALRRGVEIRFQPPSARITLTPEYRRRQVIGFSGETALLDPFVVRAEAAFHTRYLLDQPIILPTTLAALADPDFIDAVNRGFLVEKPFFKAVLGGERRLGNHLVSVQLAGRWVIDHDERVAAGAFEPAVTALWVGRFLRDDLIVRVFGLYNLGRDFWLTPEASYAVIDGLRVAAGAHVFGGEGPDRDDLSGLLRDPTLRYSLFRDNRFVYLRVLYQF